MAICLQAWPTSLNVTAEKRGEGQAYFRDAVIDHFWCPWIVMYWKTVLSIAIEVHFVKCELPKSSSVYTHIQDQLKDINP